MNQPSDMRAQQQFYENGRLEEFQATKSERDST